MKTIDLASLKPALVQNYLQHAIAPRPICLASTIDHEGHVNLSPFSFFNLFSSNPPIVIFSPARRVRDNTTKHTLQNVMDIREVVINIVDFDMVQQVSLASCEYPKGTNEFEKSGLTMQPATLVKPPMVAESKVKLECRVNEIKPLGENGGAGNLVICEVLRMHIDESILDEAGLIDQTKFELVARMGGDWYAKADKNSIFTVPKPNTHLGIGFDGLPESIRNSTVLSGNDLAQLANVDQLPVLDAAFDDERLRQIVQYYSLNPADMETEMHCYAKELLANNQTADAWQVLLSAG
jgi:flavin reductase (DIM6/NTAB) family NADH-FMN oxidoreductase RutF